MATKQETNMSTYNFDIEKYGADKNIVIEYINSLTKLECDAMVIAQDHLETSFHIMKSIGFQKWQKNKL